MVDVFIDNKYIGTVSDSKAFIEKFVNNRRMNKIPVGVNITESNGGVYVETSRGRCIRPLIVVKDGKSTLTEKHLLQLQKKEIGWSDLVKQGIVEYLDAAEEESAYVAFDESELNEEHTHLEITPMGIMGLVTTLVPWVNYNQGARILQAAKNQKQAVGLYATNFPLRIDTDVHLMHYPQTPIVRTIMTDIYNFDQHPAGQNVTLAIMSYEGYNMDDAIIFNKGSIDRGVARSTYFKPIVAEEIRYPGGLMDKISIPDKDVKGYKTEAHYRHLEEDGIAYAEAEVNPPDVVIGRVSPPRFLSSDDLTLTNTEKRESSVSLKSRERGKVDLVLLTENEEGNRFIQVRLRENKLPEIGDKFTSRHFQKGVVGMIFPEEDIPFSVNGIKPDLISSPFSIPTRMTVSHLMELIGGKVGALAGRQLDGTIFEGEKEEDVRKELASLGFREDGTETMINPITGQEYTAKIFIGSIYYQKLRHMSSLRTYARATGPVQLLTRQPTEGRAKEGGLRLGEMEKDTFVAHGASLLLKERFDSDKVVVPVCEKCGLVAVKDHRKDKLYCPICGDNVDINEIEVSYAFKLFLDEIKSLCVYPKLGLSNKY
jgi:DNA-directed RNA polymerase subunit B'